MFAYSPAVGEFGETSEKIRHAALVSRAGYRLVTMVVIEKTIARTCYGLWFWCGRHDVKDMRDITDIMCSNLSYGETSLKAR